MFNPKASITLKDEPSWKVTNNYATQAMIMALTRQNARILAKLNGTTEEEEIAKFEKESEWWFNELPYLDPNVQEMRANQQ